RLNRRMKISLLPDERGNRATIQSLDSHSSTGDFAMTRTILALGAAAVALTATPALADRHHDNGWRHHGRACMNWRHGHCVRWNNHGYMVSTAMHNRYRVGYVFGPSYGYTAYDTLPPPYVTRYHLSPDYRYVYTGGNVYVV